MAKWTRTHEQARRRILELMAEKARPFEDMSDEARQARRTLPFLDWCRTYLPHYFDRDFARFHRSMVSAAGEPGMPTFIGAFRGAGKSVLLALARPLRSALLGASPYFVYGSQVQRLASQNMDYVRLELERNERIHADYDTVSIDGPETEWVVGCRNAAAESGEGSSAECKFEAFGIGMSPRGRRSGPRRPLEFVGDDLEDAELARNPQREKNLWDWMMDEVMPALEPHHFVFTVLGTMFGPGCMLERARGLSQKSDEQGRPLAKLFVQPGIEDGRSVWPQRFSDEDLERIRAIIGIRNWQRNFALSGEDPDRPFQAAWMQEYDEHVLIDKGFEPATDKGLKSPTLHSYGDGAPLASRQKPLASLDVVCFLDPALSESTRGCPRAIIAVACERQVGTRYVLDAWIDRGSPQVMVEKVMAFNERFRPRIFGIESNGGYALIKPLLEEMSRGRRWVPARYVEHREAKEVRIERLAPQMEAGRLLFPRHPSAGVKTLQDQFLSYPDGFVDGPDACAGCGELLPDAFGRANSGFGYRSGDGRRDLAHV